MKSIAIKKSSPYLSMEYTCDKTNFNCLVNQELQRLNDLFHTQVINDEDMPFDDTIQRFGSHNNLTEKLQQWYWRHKPAPDSMNELLQILNDEGLGVPICVDGLGCDNRAEVPQSNDNAQPAKKESSINPDFAISKVQDQQKQMNAKLKLLMQEISIAKVRIDLNEGITDEMTKSADKFPIENVADLMAFEKSINDINLSAHVVTLKRIIKNEDINKSLTRILSFNILMEHNLNGTNNKLALNVYPKFLQILYRAYEKFDSSSDFTFHLKEAIKRAKNRYHKSSWQHRQKNQSDCKKFKSEEADGTVHNEEDYSLDLT